MKVIWHLLKYVYGKKNAWRLHVFATSGVLLGMVMGLLMAPDEAIRARLVHNNAYLIVGANVAVLIGAFVGVWLRYREVKKDLND